MQASDDWKAEGLKLQSLYETCWQAVLKCLDHRGIQKQLDDWNAHWMFEQQQPQQQQQPQPQAQTGNGARRSSRIHGNEQQQQQAQQQQQQQQKEKEKEGTMTEELQAEQDEDISEPNLRPEEGDAIEIMLRPDQVLPARSSLVLNQKVEMVVRMAFANDNGVWMMDMRYLPGMKHKVGAQSDCELLGWEDLSWCKIVHRQQQTSQDGQEGQEEEGTGQNVQSEDPQETPTTRQKQKEKGKEKEKQKEQKQKQKEQK